MIHIRWLIRRDMPDVLVIENESYSEPWTEEGFIHELRQRNQIGIVAEVDGQVVGFMLYELRKTSLYLINIAVHPGARRQGVARAMIEKLRSKLSPDQRSLLLADIRESNLLGQLFFRGVGMRAVKVMRKHYDNGEDAYVFRYRCQKPSKVQP